MFEAALYPPQWRAIRRAKLAQANYRCEECGVRHRSVRQNTRTGEDYTVYLSIAHRNQYVTWKKDAETMVLCQRCHRRYDRRFRRKAGRRYLTPVGYASLSVRPDRRGMGCCPFGEHHSDGKDGHPSLRVYQPKRAGGSCWYCYVWEHGGNLFDFLVDWQEVSAKTLWHRILSGEGF